MSPSFFSFFFFLLNISRGQLEWIEQEYHFKGVTIQDGSATWGLDRLDQDDTSDSSLDGIYSYTETGSGVNVYVIDSGIRTTHEEFEGRASVFFDAVDDGEEDCNGHGTHVAGTIGSATYGVAKGVNLLSVRVLDCDGSGTTTDIISGFNAISSGTTNC